MWPLPPIRDDVVSLVMSPTHLYCGHLTKNVKSELQIAAFARYEFERLTHIAITNHTHHFISEHNLFHSFATIALCPPLIHEEFIRLSKASPTPHDFQLKNMQQLIWDSHYLHALEDGNHLFYVKGIKKPFYFEQYLLAHELQLKLNTLTSTYAAQLSAYKNLQGKAFRQAKLSLDLAKHEYHIAACLSRDALARMARVSSSAQEALSYPDIVTSMIGAYYI